MIIAKCPHPILYPSSTVTVTEANSNPTNPELVTQKEVWHTGSTMFLGFCCIPCTAVAPARIHPASTTISSLSGRSIIHHHRGYRRSLRWSPPLYTSSSYHRKNCSHLLESPRGAELPNLGCQDDRCKGLYTFVDLAAACRHARLGTNNFRSILRNRHILPSPTMQSLHQLRPQFSGRSRSRSDHWGLHHQEQALAVHVLVDNRSPWYCHGPRLLLLGRDWLPARSRRSEEYGTTYIVFQEQDGYILSWQQNNPPMWLSRSRGF